MNFSSCSYLGLELDPRLNAAARDAVDRYGTQFSSSRSYLSHGMYEELEQLLGTVFRKPVVVAPTTTLGHLSMIPVLVGDNDAVILDHQVHASVATAAQQVKARGVKVEMIRHNNMAMLEQRINKLKDQYENIWYLADGIYSMFGDGAPMEDLKRLHDTYPQLQLYIDDAHGVSWHGTHGRGYVLEQLKGEWPERMYLTGSMAKSFGCVGVLNDKNQIVGIITDGDLRRKLNSKLFDKKASEIMTKKPTLANKSMLVGEAISLMNTKKITSLFICDKKKPLGIVHIHDLLRLTS